MAGAPGEILSGRPSRAAQERRQKAPVGREQPQVQLGKFQQGIGRASVAPVEEADQPTFPSQHVPLHKVGVNEGRAAGRRSAASWTSGACRCAGRAVAARACRSGTWGRSAARGRAPEPRACARAKTSPIAQAIRSAASGLGGASARASACIRRVTRNGTGSPPSATSPGAGIAGSRDRWRRVATSDACATLPPGPGNIFRATSGNRTTGQVAPPARTGGTAPHPDPRGAGGRGGPSRSAYRAAATSSDTSKFAVTDCTSSSFSSASISFITLAASSRPSSVRVCGRHTSLAVS